MPPTAEVTAEVSPARSYPELFRVTGPLLSLVFRTEDVCQRYNQYTGTFRSSQSEFPLLTPTMHAGQDSDGGWVSQRKLRNVYAASSDCVVFLWLARSGESFHAYTRFIRWDVSTVY
jgi:hypothetical protein